MTLQSFPLMKEGLSMAQTKIWDANSPYKVAWYITKKEKTLTADGKQHISTLNFQSEEGVSFASSVSRTFQQTKKMFGKENGVQCYHAEQSFVPGEVTAAEAHEIGVELAKEIWKGFEVVVSTHIDQDHIHNHFLINSVSQEDGHKYNDCLASYAKMREVSDRICLAHGLSTITNPSKNRHKNYKTWLREQEGEYATVRDWIRADIDKVLPSAASLTELYDRLEEIGYAVNTSGKYAKIRPKGKDRFFRLHKLGKGYSEEELYDRIQQNLSVGYIVPKSACYAEYIATRTLTIAYLRRRRSPSMMRAFLCYRHLAVQYVRKRPSTPFLPIALRETARDLEKVTEKTLLLCNHHIHTQEQLEEYKEEVAAAKKEKMEARQSLRGMLQREIDPEKQFEFRQQIADLTGEIQKLSREHSLCEQIQAEAASIKKQVENQEQQLLKEQKSMEETERTMNNEQ